MVYIPSSKVRFLVGKKGATVTQIQHLSGAQVSIPRSETRDHEVSVALTQVEVRVASLDGDGVFEWIRSIPMCVQRQHINQQL